MTIAWSGFPTPVAAQSGDIVVGLLGGTANQGFLAQSWLFKASNLSDVANKTTAFDNISPLTTLGDIIVYNGTHNARLAIGSNGQIMTVAGGTVSWAANPGLLKANNLSDLANLSTALTNLGLAPASNVTFASVTTTALNKTSVTNGITAHSGGGQGSAVALTTAINRIVTVAAAADSVKLPTAVAGESVTVINANVTNAINCFPNTGDAINALSANAAISVAAGSTMRFDCAVAGTWNS